MTTQFLAKNKYDLQTFETIENRIREIIRTKKYTAEETNIIKVRKSWYKDVTNIQIITLFYISHTSSMAPLNDFLGKTKAEALKHILACKKWSKVTDNKNISWETRKKIAYALAAGMEPFNGNNEEDARQYLQEYYKKIKNGNLYISKNETALYSAEHDAKIQSHLQGSVCLHCHTIEPNCNNCPEFKNRIKQAK